MSPRVNLAIQRKHVNLAREQTVTVLGIVVTLVATILLGWDMLGLIAERTRGGLPVLTQLVFSAIFLFLIYGNLLYQMTRLGYLGRLRQHRPIADDVLDAIYSDPAPPPVTMLIPSYKEEPAVVRQSLLSCALQTYPNRHVVLLIDDPYDPATAAERASLVRMRRLTVEVQAMLEQPAERCRAACAQFRKRIRSGDTSVDDELQEYNRVASAVVQWFENQTGRFPAQTHTDLLFLTITFIDRAQKERERAEQMAESLRTLPDAQAIQRLSQEYSRLATLFDVKVTGFERKRYVNLSHEPNKAMNLNSYIALVGRSFREVDMDRHLALEEADERHATLQFPYAEFLLTLDADSLLEPDYTLRLLEVMRRPGNERIAVIQTPYSAVPHATGLLERTAGATTDIQYQIHQGFTRWGATFWVGANALLRKVALDDIVIHDQERGFPVQRFIQDQTVIEDTESSIDLVRKGWCLYNYPARLSYSATPPDFGSLTIQRRRWANGGLIILPKLLRYLLRSRVSAQSLGESFMRVHYLVSIFAVNVGVLIILTYPFERELRIAWLPLTALPYYVLYGRDLMMEGYSVVDLFRVYALNLLLIPVNLAGVLKSIEQFFTGKKIPFSRTPKITESTPIPIAILVAEIALLFYCMLGSAVDAMSGRWVHAFFASFNACVFLYGILQFIGAEDCRLHLKGALSNTWPRAS